MIGETIESVLKQSHPADEVLVADDVILPDCLENLNRAYEPNPGLDLYHGDLIVSESRLNPQKRIRYPQWNDREALSSLLAFTKQLGDVFGMAGKPWVEERGGYSLDFPRCQLGFMGQVCRSLYVDARRLRFGLLEVSSTT